MYSVLKRLFERQRYQALLEQKANESKEVNEVNETKTVEVEENSKKIIISKEKL
jgi:hypothetical protein